VNSSVAVLHLFLFVFVSRYYSGRKVLFLSVILRAKNYIIQCFTKFTDHLCVIIFFEMSVLRLSWNINISNLICMMLLTCSSLSIHSFPCLLFLCGGKCRQQPLEDTKHPLSIASSDSSAGSIPRWDQARSET